MNERATNPAGAMPRVAPGEGGLDIAQSPESAEHDGMPSGALATRLVDYVLPPSEMPTRLWDYARRAGDRMSRQVVGPSSRIEDELQQVFALLLARTGHDFSQYKLTTLVRRVERRMAVQHIDELSLYIQFLRESPNELDALFQDILISVTQFFRDVEAFESLRTQAISRVLANKPPGSSIRVWVPGCATGEEAYSIAILLHEELEAYSQAFEVQIFATDIDARAIKTARAGIYPANMTADVTPARLARHFSPIDDDRYRVHKRIRDLIVFSEQDVVRDPPFSKLDLISCRNLMIYMGPHLQRKLLALFHYALKPSGFLFLGTSETAGELGELFSTIDRKAKVYLRKEDPYGPAHPPLGTVRAMPEAAQGPRPSRLPVQDRQKPALRELAERALLEDAPVAAIVNERGDLLYIHGHTGPYLQVAPGEMEANIAKMAGEGLKPSLISALHKAMSENVRVLRPSVRVKSINGHMLVDLAVRPVSTLVQGAPDSRLFLVTFAPAAQVEANVEPKQGFDVDDPKVASLLEEIRLKDEYLLAAEDQMQSTNEELQVNNEELQAANEELQSTNEELETSKEELQSLNEELVTANAELQSKVGDLSQVSNDLRNLLAATGIAMIFVDNEMCIRRFTPATTEFINVIPSDVGRPLSHIVSNLGQYDRLIADVQSVLDTVVPERREVRTPTGAAYLMRIQPYRTSNNVIEGAVITFTEAREMKDGNAAHEHKTERRELK